MLVEIMELLIGQKLERRIRDLLLLNLQKVEILNQKWPKKIGMERRLTDYWLEAITLQSHQLNQEKMIQSQKLLSL